MLEGPCKILNNTGPEDISVIERLCNLSAIPYADMLCRVFSADPWQIPAAEIWALSGGCFVARTKDYQSVERITKICRSLRDLEDTCEAIVSMGSGLRSIHNMWFDKDDYVAGMGGVFNGQAISPLTMNLRDMLRAEVVTCIGAEAIFLVKVHEKKCRCYTEWCHNPGQMDEMCWRLADAGLNIVQGSAQICEPPIRSRRP